MSLQRIQLVKRAVVPLVAALLVASCGGGAASPSPTQATTAPTQSAAASTAKPVVMRDATLRLDFAPAWYHAPFYLALDRGYYRDAGINLTIGSGQGSTTTGKTVAAGTETFGLMNYATMIQLVAQSADLRAIGEVAQRDFFAIITTSDTGIKTPKDLEGKRLGASAGSASQRLFPLFASKAGIDASAIKSVTIQGNELPALLHGDIDFYLGVAITQEPLIRQQGKTPVSMLYDEYGAGTNSYGLVTTNKLISSNSDLVKAFVAASQKGVDAAVKEPEAAAAALVAHASELAGLKNDVIAQEKQLDTYLHTAATKGKVSLCMADENFSSKIAALTTYLQVKIDAKPADLYTNAFVPGCS